MSAIAPSLPPKHQSRLPSATSLPVRGHGRFWAVLEAVPSLVVFTFLIAILAYGHHTGWKMPQAAELAGVPPVPADDWCKEHTVPESRCIECRPELLPKGDSFGFCREHGVAECVLHHPELSQTKGEPRLPGYDTVQALALLPRPENNSRNTLHTHRVQFASVEAVSKAGIDVDLVQERPISEAVSANGELRFEPTATAHLAARVPGTVAFVLKSIGDPVARGDVLALVDAAQVGQAKADLLQAVVQLRLRRNAAERLGSISGSGAVPQKAVAEAESAKLEAEIAVIAARQTLGNLGLGAPGDLDSANPARAADALRFLGIPDSLVATLPAGAATANLLPLKAPFDGVVTAAEVTAGEAVDSARPMFTVADPSRMWLLLNVRQEDAKYLRTGLPVTFLTDADGREVRGPVAWISPTVDERTRTVPVRISVVNPGGILKNGSYGTGRIVLRGEPNAVTVPREAVRSTADAHFVFVRDKNFFDEGSPKFFHVRQVRLGGRHGEFVELVAGVLPGEIVAVRGSSVLLAQLLRGNLGAGCGCHED